MKNGNQSIKVDMKEYNYYIETINETEEKEYKYVDGPFFTLKGTKASLTWKKRGRLKTYYKIFRRELGEREDLDV